MLKNDMNKTIEELNAVFQEALRTLWSVGPEGSFLVSSLNSSKFVQHRFDSNIPTGSAAYDAPQRTLVYHPDTPLDSLVHKIAHEGSHSLQHHLVPECFAYSMFLSPLHREAFLSDPKNLFLIPSDFMGASIMTERLAHATQLQIAFSLAEQGALGPMQDLEFLFKKTHDQIRYFSKKLSNVKDDQPNRYKAGVRAFLATEHFDLQAPVQFYHDHFLNVLHTVVHGIAHAKLPPIPQDRFVRFDRESMLRLADATGLNFWRLGSSYPPDIMADVRRFSLERSGRITARKIERINNSLGLPPIDQIPTLTEVLQKRTGSAPSPRLEEPA